MELLKIVMLDLQLKKEFSGVIDIQIQDGCYVGFNSANAYRNCKTTIINSSEKYEVSVPTYFKNQEINIPMLMEHGLEI